MSTGNSIALIVLGAGRGTRFGQPKALAEVAPGVRFLDAIVETATAAGVSRIIAILPPGVVARDGVMTVVNENGGGEQIDSVRRGLAALGPAASGALLWPVDHPFVRPGTVRALLDVVRTSPAPAIVPAYEGRRGHPVYFRRSTWAALETVEDGGARSVLHSLSREVVEVTVGDPGILADVNTTQDLALWAGAAADGAARR